MGDAVWQKECWVMTNGKWTFDRHIDIERLDDYDRMDGAVCSECHEAAFYDECCGAILSRYCPNCGSKMLNDYDTLCAITYMANPVLSVNQYGRRYTLGVQINIQSSEGESNG